MVGQSVSWLVNLPFTARVRKCARKGGGASGVSPVLAGTPESTKISRETAVVTAPVMAGNSSPPPLWPTRTIGFDSVLVAARTASVQYRH